MILDTNAVSDFADANQGLLDRLQQSAEDIHLPVIVLGEYRYGVKSSRLRAARESWLDELESTAIVLAVTSEQAVFTLISVTSSDSLPGLYRRTTPGLPS
jgi:tRNA(fMet)-specific endonuclease VapC